MDLNRINSLNWNFGTSYDRELRDSALRNLEVASGDRADFTATVSRKVAEQSDYYKDRDKAAIDAYLDLKGSDYSEWDHFKDAVSDFFQSMNKSQADDMVGQSVRAQENIDSAEVVKQYLSKKQIDDDIQKYFDDKIAGKDVSEDIKQLQKHFPKIDFSNGVNERWLKQYQNNLGVDLLNNKDAYNKAFDTIYKTQPSNILSKLKRELGIAIHDNSDRDFNSVTGPMQDWIGDRVTDASALLSGFSSATNGEKIKMLNEYQKQLKDVQEYSKAAKEQNDKEAAWYDKAHKVSDYYRTRSLKSQMDLQNGGSMWTWDNLTYGNISQMGFSSSSWDKLGASMALQALGAIVTGGTSTIGTIAGTGLIGAGAVAQYQAGTSENNAEIAENFKTRITNQLKKDKLYDSVIKDGMAKFKGATESDIIEKIARGEYIPEKSKSLHSVAEAVRDSLSQSRKGANALFERDMYAVAGDAMVDMAIVGPKGLGSGLIKAVNKTARFTPVKNAGKWIMDRGLKGVDSAYTTATKLGLGIGGGAVASAGKTVANLAKYATPKYGLTRNAMAWVEKEVNAGRHLVSKVLAKTHIPDETKDFVLRQRLNKYLRTPLNFAKGFAIAGHSESIEEGKQGMNAVDWINNTDEDQVVGFFDGVMRDMSYGSQLITSALGVPLGARWGLAANTDMYPTLYSEMAGGWIGGSLHMAQVGVIPAGVDMYSRRGSISIADAIAANTELGVNTALSRFTKGSDLVNATFRNPKSASREFAEFEEFNKNRRRTGLTNVSDEDIAEEKDYMNKLISNANNPIVRQQAEAAGIEVGTKDFADFVSGLTMYRELAKEDNETINKTGKSMAALASNIEHKYTNEQEMDEDDILEQTVGGSGKGRNTSTQVELLRELINHKNPKHISGDIVERYQREQEHAKKAEEGNKRSKNALNTMQETDSEVALENSVGREQSGQYLSIYDAIVAVGSIHSLQEMVNNIETASEYSGVRSKHEVLYYKDFINKKISALKKLIPNKELLNRVLENPLSVFDTQENLDQFKALVLENTSARVGYNISKRIEELFTGTRDIQLDPDTSRIVLGDWKLSKAKDVIAKLKEGVDEKYELIDEINKYYERELMGLNDPMSLIRNQQETPQEQPEQLQSQPVVQPEPSVQPPAPQENEVRQPVTPQPVQPLQPEPVLQQPQQPEPQQQPQQGPTNPYLNNVSPVPEPVVVNNVQPLQVQQPVQLSQDQLQQLNGALDVIAERLNLSRFDDYQVALDNVLDQELDKAGQTVVGILLDSGVYTIENVIKHAHMILVNGGFTQLAINKVLPYIPRFYASQIVLDKYNEVEDQLSSLKEIRNINVFDVVRGLPQPKPRSIQPQQFTPTLKQQEVFDRLEQMMTEDDKKVVGKPTSHDYFVKEDDGYIHLYPRVHTVNGPQFEQDPTRVQAKQKAFEALDNLLSGGDVEAAKDVKISFLDTRGNVIERSVKDLKDLDRYLQILSQYDEGIAPISVVHDVVEALSSMLVEDSKGPGLVIGEMVDKIVRIFFEGGTLDYNTFSIQFNSKNVNAKDIMTKEAFDTLVSDLKKTKERYEKAGYLISVKEHTIFTTLQNGNKTVKVAGQTDIIAIDKEGNLHVIDTKTSRKTFAEYEGNRKGNFYETPALFGKYKTLRNYVDQYSIQLSTYLQMLLNKYGLTPAQFPLELLPVRLDYDYNTLIRNIENPGKERQGVFFAVIGQYNEPEKILLNVRTDIFGNVLDVDTSLDEEIDQLLIEINSKSSDIDYIDRDQYYLDYDTYKTDKLKQHAIHIEKLIELLDSLYRNLTNDRSRLVYESTKQSLRTLIDEYDNLTTEHNQEIVNEREKQMRSEELLEKSNAVNNIRSIQQLLYNMCMDYNNKKVDADKNALRSDYLKIYAKCSELRAAVQEFANKYPNNINEISSALKLLKNVEQHNFEEELGNQQEPVKPQRVSAHGGRGYMWYNTISQRDQESSVSVKNPSVKLSDVCGEPEFEEEAVVEIVGEAKFDNFYKINDAFWKVPVKITYKGHEFTTVHVELSRREGREFAGKINEALRNAGENEKVVFILMDRTFGKPHSSENPINILDSIIVSPNTKWSDISTEGSQRVFGLARRPRLGRPVEVTNQSQVIYTFPNNVGTPGVYYAIIYPDYRNKTLSSEPIEIPLVNETMSKEDAELLIQLFKSNKTLNVVATTDSGKLITLNITNNDLINLLIPIGEYSDKDRSLHVQIQGNTVKFTHEYDPETKRTYDIFDMSINGETGIDGLYQYLLKTRINVNKDLVNSRINNGRNSHQLFRSVTTAFNRSENKNTNTITIGNSRLKFSREDLQGTGISGLAWFMKNNILVTYVDKVVNPRVSFNDIETITPQPNTSEDNADVVTQLDDKVEDDPIDPSIFGQQYYLDDYQRAVDDSSVSPDWEDNGHNLEDSIVRQRISRILGDSVPVSVAESVYQKIKTLPPGQAGTALNDLIQVCASDKEGIEYEYAFSRIYKHLLSEKQQQKMLNAARKAYAKVVGKKYAQAVDDSVIENFAARKCREYLVSLENIKFDLKKPFNFIYQHYIAYKKIGSFRLYKLYMAINHGEYANRKKQSIDSELDDKLERTTKYYKRHGREFTEITSDRQYKQMVQSFAYYICKIQSIDPDGRNIENLDISKEAIEKEYEYEGVERFSKKEAEAFNANSAKIRQSLLKEISELKRKLKSKKSEEELEDIKKQIELKESVIRRIPFKSFGDVKLDNVGEPIVVKVKETLRQMMTASCRNTNGISAMEEMIDNWDVVRHDVRTYLHEIGIDLKSESGHEYEKLMLAGDGIFEDETNDEEENFFSILLKDTFETAHHNRASKGVKCFMSMIKQYEIHPVTGKWIPSRNECGFYKHMDYKEVLNMLFSDCSSVKTPSEMMRVIQRKSNEGNPVYRQIFEAVRPYYRKQKNKDGSLNANKEQFVTQLFNLLACTQNKFKAVSANLTKQGLYIHSINDCGQEYETNQMRGEWGKLLVYGGRDLFEKIETDQIKWKYDQSAEEIGSINRLGAVFDTLEDIRAFFSSKNMQDALTGVENRSKLTINIPHLRIFNHVIDLANNNSLEVLKRDVCSMLNYVGIQISINEFDFILEDKFGENSLTNVERLNAFFNQTGGADIQNLWNSKSGIHIIKKVNTQAGMQWQWNINSYNQTPEQLSILNTIIHPSQHKFQVQAENVYTKNSFAIDISNYLYKYRHKQEDLSVLVTNNKRYYTVSENNMITDVTDDISKGGKIAETLSKYCYNITDDGKGSIILKQARELKKGEKLPILVCTLAHFKSNETQNEGHDYFDISEVEDYVCKATLLENGHIVFPTMSDKKTWVFLDGIVLPGITYSKTDGDEKTIVASNINDGECLEQLVEYAYSEYEAVKQVVENLKEIDKHPELKVQNYHNGVWVGQKVKNLKDAINTLVEYKYIESSKADDVEKELRKQLKDNKKEDGSSSAKFTSANGRGRIELSIDKNDKKSVKFSHNVPQGAVFGSFTGIYNRSGEYISFNTVIDENGKYVTPELNLKKAEKYFFKSYDGVNEYTTEQLKDIIRRAILKQVQKEIEHMIKLGLVERGTSEASKYINKGLNSAAISAIQKAYVNQGKVLTNSQAIEKYAADLVYKSIMSINEVERIYSGNPAFFKWKFNQVTKKINGKTVKVTTLTDRATDQFKRLGGLISTGVNNNIEIAGAPEDGMYNCSIINDVYVGSKQADKIKELMSEAEWRAAYRNIFKLGSNFSEEARLKFEEDLLAMSLADIKAKIKTESDKPNGKYRGIYQIIESKVNAETDSYYGGINVADGAAYISPEMTEWLLRMCGCYDKKVLKAFEILKNPDSNIEEQAEAYKIVTTNVIGAQKYTAYGQRLSEDGKTMVPYYNKMALFPVFKCIATGEFSVLYDKMLKQQVHMLMMESAVKIGEQGKQNWKADDYFQFNVFKQSFKYLRKQFNTDPHHQEDQSMGTQMVKVALASLIKDHKYGDKTGQQILDEIMDDINTLCDQGEIAIQNELFDSTGENLDLIKFSKFLHENLTSRDADDSILESIEMIRDADGNPTMRHPLAAISRLSWLQSIIASYVNKEMVDVKTKGSAFYQRSVFGMEGAVVMKGENMPSALNDGQELEMIIEEGPGKGAMDCILTIDYFREILEKAGLEDASFNEQKQFLKDNNIIGKNAEPNLIGYRIPTQAQSSIHPLRCVDVLPVIQHTIILPKEFTKITGSDFDIDKIFIASIDYDVKDNKASKSHAISTRLLENYITILKDESSAHIAHRSIDNDTTLLTDVVDFIREGKASDVSEYEIYDFEVLRNHTDTKNQFLTGKTGIGPFALNNNSQILTMLYGVEFSDNSVMSALGHGSLCKATDDYGQSIMSWISALINAHVDIAKDPYISELNVNKMTYNLVNLMIRTGYGETTFFFTTQQVMKDMALEFTKASTEFMKDPESSMYQMRKEAKRKAAVNLCGEEDVKWAEELIYSDKDLIKKKTGWNNIVKSILKANSKDLRDFSRGIIHDATIKDSNNKNMKITYKQYQALIYVIDNLLSSPAQDLSDVVKYSKIDTKKQGKNISEQIAYAKGVAKTFHDYSLLEDLFMQYGSHEDELGIIAENNDLKFKNLDAMYEKSFLKHKTHKAMSMYSKILRGLVIEAAPSFQRALSLIADRLGKTNAKDILKISDAMAAKLKADLFYNYALDNNINIPGLVSGQNTIYDRLLNLKFKIANGAPVADSKYWNMNEKQRAEYDAMAEVNGGVRQYEGETNGFEHLRDVDGTPKNYLLKLLIADVSKQYQYIKHMDQVPDKFSNFKFVRLFDALDMSASKTDNIIQAWKDLLNDPNKEVRDFARDLCVYAFYTSGELQGRTNMFKFVPNSFRETSGYVQYVRDILNNLNNPEWVEHTFNAEFLDDVVLNNHYDTRSFVRKVTLKPKNPVPGAPVWRAMNVYPEVRMENGRKIAIDFVNGRYTPTYPIFITTLDYVDMSQAPMYISIKRTGNDEDGFNRGRVLYKRVMKVTNEETHKVKPVYVKVNARGYKVGEYRYFEYGNSRIPDTEYFPSAEKFRSMPTLQIESIPNFDSRISSYVLSVMRSSDIDTTGLEQQSEEWIGDRTYAPVNTTDTTNTQSTEELRPQSPPKPQHDLSSALDLYQQYMNREDGKADSENRQFAEDTNVSTDDERTETSLDALDRIISSTNNELYKKLAQWLKKYVEKHKVKVVYTNKGGSSSGVTHTSINDDGSISQEIEIFTNSPLYKAHPEQTLLHEILHSVTNVTVKIFKTRNSNLELKQYMDYIKTFIDNERPGMSEKIYGLSKPEEFVAEYYTNPAFQQILKNIPAMETTKFRNMFDQIISWIMKILNIQIKESENALDQLRPVMYGIVECEYKLDFSNTSLGNILEQSVDKQAIPLNYPLTGNVKNFIDSGIFSVNTSNKDKLDYNNDVYYTKQTQNGQDFKYVRARLLNDQKKDLFEKLYQYLKNRESDFIVTRDGNDILVSSKHYVYNKQDLKKEVNIDYTEQLGWYDRTNPVSDQALRDLDLDDYQYSTVDQFKDYLKAMGEQMLKTQCIN